MQGQQVIFVPGDSILAAHEYPKVICISDDEDQGHPVPTNGCLSLPPCQPITPYRQVENPKHELYDVVNAFQNSQDYGVYVCQKFKDPRRYYIDSYYGEVAHEAFGMVELGALLGRTCTPLSEEARREFARFATTLRELAERVERALG